MVALGRELKITVAEVALTLAEYYWVLVKLEGHRLAALRLADICQALRELCEKQKEFYDEVYRECDTGVKGGVLIADLNVAKKIIIYGNLQFPGRPDLPITGDLHKQEAWKYNTFEFVLKDNEFRAGFHTVTKAGPGFC